MAAPAPVTLDTPIVIKITVNGTLKKLKLPLRDLGAAVLPGKLRQVLDIKPEQHMLLERFSDSSGDYVTLGETNPQVFKTLIRAAKAKGKLRLKATVSSLVQIEATEETSTPRKKASSTRESTALDQRSVGSGIFQFREARDRASQQTLINLSDEAPVPRPFVDGQTNFFDKLAGAAAQPLAFRTREVPQSTATIGRAWSVYCNECDKAMDDVHFHCSICDGGDYDLCKECVDEGKHCAGDDHWLIKRFIKNGEVVPCETERVSPRKAAALPVTSSLIEKAVEKDMPGAFSIPDEPKAVFEEPRVATRTCNSCVIVLPEHEFVTCSTCDDYDLCVKCVGTNDHGHHPAHGFEPATPETVLPLACAAKLPAGRNVRHSAVCDGCDKPICGVRHKCLVCPDWDYCNDCVKNARHTHPRHRFAALYEPIGDQEVVSMVRHFGIYCDGPLCSSKGSQSYIHGVRYKCTICSDTDFCGSCEALPGNHHNRTHPLIKFKTPVRNVNVMTENEDVRGNVKVLGDRRCPAPQAASQLQPTKSTSTETTPFLQANAATQVQTVAEIMPTEVKKETMPIPIPVKKFVETTASAPAASLLNAHFVRDTVPDGMKVQPEVRFTQSWILTNPGPHAWPAGCSVRYVGGDNMLNVDNSHPASVAAIADATESNVVGREVQAGEVVAFKVVLKAPVREGKSISYWRLKAADGTPFGHRLWCDIEVKKEEEPVENAKPVNVFQQAQLQQAQLQAMRAQMQAQQIHAAQTQQTQTQQAQVQAQVQAQAQAHHAHQFRLQAQQAQAQQVQAQQIQAQAAQAQRARLQQMANARSEHVAQQKKAIAAHQQARDLWLNSQPSVSNTPVSPVQLPSARLSQPPVYRPFEAPRPSEQPPAYESTNLSARLAAMREQQKQRREQMLAQLNAQRDANHARSMPSAASSVSPPPFRRSPDVAAAEKERHEALKQRVAHIKANILKTREEREKLTDDLSQRNVNTPEKVVVDEVAKNVEDDAKKSQETAAEEKADEQLSESQMVFPKLDKESPASSLYGSATSGSSKAKAAYVENEDGEVENAAIPAPTFEQAPSVSSAAEEDDFVDLDDELEVLSASGDESDDGFLTDEEYDILDASDSETVASGWRG